MLTLKKIAKWKIRNHVVADFSTQKAYQRGSFYAAQHLENEIPPALLPSRFLSSFQSEDTQQQIIRETFHLVSKRDENVCNFLEGGL